MNLSELGYDSWCGEHYGGRIGAGFAAARVTRVDRDRYLVRGEHGEVQGEATGRLLYSADAGEDLPCAGDWVVVQYHNDGELAIIHEVLPRKSYLRRKAPGKNAEYQMIAANIDVAFIMQSCDFNFNLRRLERYLVMVNEGRVSPAILLSKTDLIDADELSALISEIRQIQAPVIPFSNRTGLGLEMVKQALHAGQTYCLLGSSGVGKTTLLNTLLGREAFETQPVREKDGRGMHTTSRRQLSVLGTGALLIDTPGMRELGLMAVEETIDQSFADIDTLSENCRFDDCSHTVEPGCAILQALEAGQLGQERYESYRKLIKESEFHAMSYLERRRKEKQFGRMVKSAMDELKKWKPSAS
jgi:ribosome biogenesis GTPase